MHTFPSHPPSPHWRALGAVFFAALLLAGCVSPAPPPPINVKASTETVGSGSRTVFIVGVYEDQVYYSRTEREVFPCAYTDWRVVAATNYTKENGTYVFNTGETQEFSVRNETPLIERLNETMRAEKPAILSWETLRDRGCQYQHRDVVINVTLHAANDTEAR